MVFFLNHGCHALVSCKSRFPSSLRFSLQVLLEAVQRTEHTEAGLLFPWDTEKKGASLVCWVEDRTGLSDWLSAQLSWN